MTAVPNDKHTPNPVAGSGVLEKDDITFHEYNSFPQLKDLQEAVLRGFLACRADRVLALVTDLGDEDFPDYPHRMILHAIVEVAQGLVAAGEGDNAVTPEVVQIALRNAAVHTHSLMTTTLLNVTTGRPPAVHDLQQLCAELKTQTLRRALHGYGQTLITAAQGPSDLLAPVLHKTRQLQELARRAGLEVVA